MNLFLERALTVIAAAPPTILIIGQYWHILYGKPPYANNHEQTNLSLTDCAIPFRICR